jgi:hypothetical protein
MAELWIASMSEANTLVPVVVSLLECLLVVVAALLAGAGVVISGGGAIRLSVRKYPRPGRQSHGCAASESNRRRQLANTAIATVVASLGSRPLSRGGSAVSTTREFSEIWRARYSARR